MEGAPGDVAVEDEALLPVLHDVAIRRGAGAGHMDDDSIPVHVLADVEVLQDELIRVTDPAICRCRVLGIARPQS